MIENEIFVKNDEEIISYDIIKHLINGWIEIEDIKIPKISAKLKLKDTMLNAGVRLGYKRMEYKIPTGLYAMGNPDKNDKVIVSCNYKLSFDILRNDLKGLDIWILVLDTKGINVWCAAGKGTFSSKELMYQLHKWKVKEILDCKKVILPQLGATSMEPHLVKKYMGVEIIYGPVRSRDLKKFIGNECEADEEMRQVEFGFKDRMILSPIELIFNIKFWLISLIASTAYALTNGIQPLLQEIFVISMPTLLGLITATFGLSAILPLLPFRYFSMNGAILGLPLALIILIFPDFFGIAGNPMFSTGYAVLLIAMISWITFKFTGSTTYTSMSGVEIEAKKITPIIKVFTYIGALLVFAGMVMKFVI